MSPLNITQSLGIWSIMATIRWCPIFPKWDIYQPLLNVFKKNRSEKNWCRTCFVGKYACTPVSRLSSSEHHHYWLDPVSWFSSFENLRDVVYAKESTSYSSNIPIIYSNSHFCRHSSEAKKRCPLIALLLCPEVWRSCSMLALIDGAIMGNRRKLWEIMELVLAIRKLREIYGHVPFLEVCRTWQTNFCSFQFLISSKPSHPANFQTCSPSWNHKS